MSDFNWNDHPIEDEKNKNSNGFNWDEHPIDDQSENSLFGITGKGLAKGAVEALPIAGSIAGGLIGSGVGPVGTIGGAGLGAAAGKSLEQAVKEFQQKNNLKVTGQIDTDTLNKLMV